MFSVFSGALLILRNKPSNVFKGDHIKLHFAPFIFRETTLMSGIERKYCLISASYLTGLFEIFVLLHI